MPFYAIHALAAARFTTVLWPFFNWIDDREKKYREWQGPWPFVIFARGEGKTTDARLSAVQPVAQRHAGKRFLSLAALQFNRTHADPLDQRRTRVAVLSLFAADGKKHQTGAEKSAPGHVAVLSPGTAISTATNGCKCSRPSNPPCRTIAASNATGRRSGRSGARRQSKTGAASQSLLWNLYRRETAPAHKKVSLLFGLFQYQCDGGNPRRVCFTFPFQNGRSKCFISR
jgi:hypothetical protein